MLCFRRFSAQALVPPPTNQIFPDAPSGTNPLFDQLNLAASLLCHFLGERKYRSVPPAHLRRALAGIRNLEQLKNLLGRILDTGSWEELIATVPDGGHQKRKREGPKVRDPRGESKRTEDEVD